MPMDMTQPEDRPGDTVSRRPGTLVLLIPLLILATLALLATVMATAAVIDSNTVIDTTVEWSDEEYIITANVNKLASST